MTLALIESIAIGLPFKRRVSGSGQP
ncbi:hypothetical protein SPHINGOT1_260305 [Sphingomonas sp. T1]|nr:hypothetical protein SPHINGOT1_260305 [Sphingomonas sp. T1]